MATPQKRNASGTLHEIYDGIRELLIKVKDTKDRRSCLVDNLHKLATLATRFTELHPKPQMSWIDMADVLHREGVQLWNTASLIQHQDGGDNGPLVAALRLAGFRLMEAGLEKKPGIQSLIHVLQTASKTGSTLSEIGMHDTAASVLGCAAKFEDMLRNSDDSQGLYQQGKARATVVYLSCRMEAAFREGNESIAEYMLGKITDHNDRHIALLPSHDHEALAAKLLKIGESILHAKEGKEQGQNAPKAIKWLQQAFTIAEKVDNDEIPGAVELKRCILTCLANAYLHSASHDAENLTRAETTLQELLTSVRSAGNIRQPEYQELLWLRWFVLKRRSASDIVLLEAFTAVLENTTFSEDTITLIFREFEAFGDRHAFVTELIRECLKRALGGAETSGLPFVDRLLLALIVHCARDDDHTRAMSDLDAAFTLIAEAEFSVSEVPAAACVALLWRYGDRHYRAKRWLKAADWFTAGAHRALQNLTSSTSKCYRKAALCHIYQGDYSTATTIVRRCSGTEAATHYVLLLAAVHQGLEDEAITAVEGMIKAPDFHRDMLLLATQLSHESKMKTLLLTTLEALLHTLKSRETADVVTEAMTVIRCIIRLVQSLLAEPTAKKSDLITALSKHFLTTCSFAQEAKEKKFLPVLLKDIMWLWRTAYNCAVQGCSEWENAEEPICVLFDVARKLLELYCEAQPVGEDTDLHLYIIDAFFASVAGRAFIMRRSSAEDRARMDEQRRHVLDDIRACKEKIDAIKVKANITAETEAGRIYAFLHTLHLLEVELLVEVKEWKRIADVTQQILQADASSMSTFEAVADILWTQEDCPVDVLHDVLERILHTSLDRGILSLEKFSRWLRSICTILLGRNSRADRVKAIGYVEQAIGVMGDSTDEASSADDTYPMDERHWLLATSNNMGIECLKASLLDEAKRWFEAATLICRYVPDGERHAEQISDVYSCIMARITSK